MSRILRRPMFRGGRVDSRGTGIASGLSYAKGGSVNTPKRGLVNEPGGYAGEKDYPGFMKSPVYKGGRYLVDYLGKPVANVVNQYGVNPIASLFGYPGLMEQMETPYDYADAKLWNYFGGGKHPIYNPDGDFRTDDTIANKIWADRYKSENFDNVTTAITDSGAIPKAIKQQENTILLEKLEAEKNKKKSLEEIMKEMMGPKKTAKEKVDEYKEVFQDAYGSGVADDASTMALSLAGKMLKPGATVKSGFGEFFEEEGKRPSDRKKYKDAATTAAINAYLTGEKDYDSMMKQMKIIDYQIGAKSDAAKAAKKALSFSEIKAGLPGTLKDREKTKTAAELFIQYTDPGKSLTVIEEDEETPELLKAPENEGLYFMNRETKEVFKILKGIKQIIYGG
jgi:hypothetical protein